MNAFRACALTLLLTTGCAGPGLLASEPMGKQLERALEEIKKDCIKRGAPPFGENRPGRFDTSCLMFTLKPWEPGDTPESAFAHSIKLPPPHDKPKDVYKPGMSSEAYLKALCEAEAGEWVFRRVEGVRGIRQERPKLQFPLGAYGIVYFTVESAYRMDSNMQGYLIEKPIGKYDYLEVRNFERLSGPSDSNYVRFFRTPGSQEMESTNSVGSANYAYIWRGIRRADDRLHAIRGDELIIYQVTPFEVLAFRRMFFYRYLDGSTPDPRIPAGKGCTYDPSLPHVFIESVLIPAVKKQSGE